MTPKLYAVSSILLATLSLGQPAPEVAGGSTRLAWDHDGLGEDGTPETLAAFELGAWDLTGQTLIASRSIPACEATGAMTCEEALSGLGLASGVYSLRVRAVDGAGNASAWSAQLVVRLDLVPPSRPSGCRLIR